MSNPFERADTRFRVLVNGEGQHSLWPEPIDVPAGWRVTFGPDTREACLEHVDREWADLRPASLRGR